MDVISEINLVNTLWIILSTLLVLIMVIPGMALFYAGMVRRKNTLSVVIQVTTAFVVGVVLWFVYGYSLVFTEFNSLIGGFSRFGLSGMINLADNTLMLTDDIPELNFMLFQAMFAGLACALIVGALVERIKLGSLLIFIAIWFTLSYLPIAHMVWYSSELNPGWLFERGALDFAGGTVVHINAGVAAIVGAFLIGKRKGFGRDNLKPHNLVMTYIGVAFMWLGWFGFNAGSALGISFSMLVAFANTLIAGVVGIVTWAIIEKMMHGKVSLLGLCSGLIAGLVGITPAAAFVGLWGAFAISLLTTVGCYFIVEIIKHRYRIDDSLDVFGIHGVGGIFGAFLTGIFCFNFLGGTELGNFKDLIWQLWIQLEGAILTMIWSALVSVFGIKVACYIFKETRVNHEQELTGLDISLHAESLH
ncbi:ammonium transporter [Thorsellia anophelis]|uniref:Ammonium transporter n=1 Tax=Thorsellia anophelis DSM 18579 TaxID=1123402 RepID=A0A1H9ZBK1_9GAMM|nr:ammonium transporter [Thorsellia anophelis]SES78695.1 ammonium transporter [Thorsellia anophelis DSM 18579]